MTVTSAIELFLNQLRELYRAETQLGVSLQSLATLANHRSLRHMIVRHLVEIDRQKERIEKIFLRYDIAPPSDLSLEMKTLVDGGKAQLSTAPSVETRDLLLIVHCLRIEQYEMSAYEITARLAEQLGLLAEAEMLAECLAERDASAEILKKLQTEILRLAFPTEIAPKPIFQD